MSIYIYETFLRRGEIGKAMAAAILLFVTAFVILRLRSGFCGGGRVKPRMTLRWIVFAIAAFVMNFPVLATLITAFKPPGEVRGTRPSGSRHRRWRTLPRS
jgi:membrane protease YdiL (CAAX protease family)